MAKQCLQAGVLNGPVGLQSIGTFYLGPTGAPAAATP